ncbi:MAG TPA: BNR-4 repeat-containing protein, partial [Pirellulales bacterium]
MKKSRSKLATALVCLAASMVQAHFLIAADFTGPLITFNLNGGWSWFSDPRATIDNGKLIIGSIAGVAGSGSTAGDVDVTTYDFATHTINESLLHTALTQDDHADPAFAALPDGRILVTYQAHGSDNFVHWRIGTSTGATISWAAEQTSTVNTVNDGNGNTYGNPFYLSTPNEVVNFSRAVGYDPNYSVFSNLGNTTPTFAYGGHWMYWKNPNNQTLTGGNGRPYVKYASNGSDTVWFATTEDSPQNYPNSLYAGYIQFNAAGAGSVFTSTGSSLGGLSTGTAPTGGSNPPAAGNSGSILSGSGNSYLPTQFTPIVKANQNFNGVNLTGKYVGWASSMQLDGSGNPYLGFVVVDNLNGAYGNDLEYYFAHFNGAAWQVSRVGYAGLPLYNSQNQYAGLMAVDPLDPNKIYISADVDPTTDA